MAPIGLSRGILISLYWSMNEKIYVKKDVLGTNLELFGICFVIRAIGIVQQFVVDVRSMRTPMGG